MEKSIINQIYDDLAATWWNEDGILYLLKSMVNPWRVPFFKEVLRDHFGTALGGYRLLDIGCGGGVLTEEFSRLGINAAGIDISPISIQIARVHSKTERLEIDYQIGSALEIDFPEGSFDIVSCCDVLEHIAEWKDLLPKISHILKPGGVLLFDTINRTRLSWILFIFGLQIFPFTNLFPNNTHQWRMFITPDELVRESEVCGMKVEKMVGGEIKGDPKDILNEVRNYKKGLISVADLGDNLVLNQTDDLSLNYMGYAIKSKTS